MILLSNYMIYIYALKAHSLFLPTDRRSVSRYEPFSAKERKSIRHMGLQTIFKKTLESLGNELKV